MNTMKWLVRREFWEHKGMFFWAPIVVCAILGIFISATMLYAMSTGHLHASYSINGHDGSFNNLAASMTPEERAGMVDVLAAGYMAVSVPVFLMLAVVVFFYCLGALYDERRDRSILFWKSLPVSDSMTVLSKTLLALGLAPLITIVLATITSLVLLFVLCIAFAVQGVNIFGLVLSNSALYLTPLRLLGMLPVYALWAVPTVGWLLMVSSWARSKVFLWAVGAPLLALAVAAWANHLFGFNWDIQWFAHNVLARAFGGVVPGAWLLLDDVPMEILVNHANSTVDMGSVFQQSWLTLGSARLWIGIVFGSAMIFVSMRVRRWRDEG